MFFWYNEMQSDGVFYLHCNLLFQQVTGFIIGFPGLVKKVPSTARNTSTLHQTTRSKVLGTEVQKEKENNINNIFLLYYYNDNTKRPRDLRNCQYPNSSRMPKWSCLYLDTGLTEQMLFEWIFCQVHHSLTKHCQSFIPSGNVFCLQLRGMRFSSYDKLDITL